MNGFFWMTDHLRWSIFSLAVFTSLWLLLSDLVWRLTAIRICQLGPAMFIGWLIVTGLILLGFYLGHG